MKLKKYLYVQPFTTLITLKEGKPSLQGRVAKPTTDHPWRKHVLGNIDNSIKSGFVPYGKKTNTQ